MLSQPTCHDSEFVTQILSQIIALFILISSCEHVSYDCDVVLAELISALGIVTQQCLNRKPDVDKWPLQALLGFLTISFELFLQSSSSLLFNLHSQTILFKLIYCLFCCKAWYIKHKIKLHSLWSALCLIWHSYISYPNLPFSYNFQKEPYSICIVVWWTSKSW